MSQDYLGIGIRKWRDLGIGTRKWRERDSRGPAVGPHNMLGLSLFLLLFIFKDLMLSGEEKRVTKGGKILDKKVRSPGTSSGK